MVQVDQQFSRHVVCFDIFVVFHKYQFMVEQSAVRNEFKILQKLDDRKYLSSVKVVQLKLL